MRLILTKFIRQLRAFLASQFRQYNRKLPYIITATIGLIIMVGGINLFIELTENLKTEVLADYDTRITQYIITFRTPARTQFFLFVTDLGGLYGYLIVLAIWALLSYAIFKSCKYVAQTTLVLVLASVSNMTHKRFIDRARPGIEHLVSVETLSYPSGHAMGAMAFYGFLIYLIYTFKINKFLKLGLITILIVLILSIGISRIYLGVHFPSDVAGGFIAGFIWVIFCILIFNMIRIFKRDPNT